MSASVGLYSRHLITKEELAEVILDAGGVITSEAGARSFGGVINGDAYVWINIIPCYDGVFDYEGNPLDEKEVALLEQAKLLLGGEFQTWIYVSLGRTPGSQRQAVLFAYTCCQRWPCVVDNDQGQLFSCEDIAKLHEEGGGFTAYGL
jgi:hypothetical protein